jgi:hypothetical protein
MFLNIRLLFGPKPKWAWISNGRNNKFIQNYGEKILRKGTSWERRDGDANRSSGRSDMILTDQDQIQ